MLSTALLTAFGCSKSLWACISVAVRTEPVAFAIVAPFSAISVSNGFVRSGFPADTPAYFAISFCVGIYLYDTTKSFKVRSDFRACSCRWIVAEFISWAARELKWLRLRLGCFYPEASGHRMDEAASLRNGDFQFADRSRRDLDTQQAMSDIRVEHSAFESLWMIEVIMGVHIRCRQD
jgi:hypothetical protein